MSGAGELKLCYVDDPWAWFTTAPLDQQFGDDWDDAPYEHNAGNPYPILGERLMRLAFVGPVESPFSYVPNSMLSVEDINAMKAPWLRTDRYTPTQLRMTCWAGASLMDFVKAMKGGGCALWAPMEDCQ